MKEGDVKVCDLCLSVEIALKGQVVQTKVVGVLSDGERMDLCEECTQVVRQRVQDLVATLRHEAKKSGGLL